MYSSFHNYPKLTFGPYSVGICMSANGQHLLTVSLSLTRNALAIRQLLVTGRPKFTFGSKRLRHLQDHPHGPLTVPWWYSAESGQHQLTAALPATDTNKPYFKAFFALSDGGIVVTRRVKSCRMIWQTKVLCLYMKSKNKFVKNRALLKLEYKKFVTKNRK